MTQAIKGVSSPPIGESLPSRASEALAGYRHLTTIGGRS
jgi:hypothetical protein